MSFSKEVVSTTMPLHPLTYTRDAAPCPTIPGRTGKALVGSVKYPKTILQDSVTISA